MKPVTETRLAAWTVLEALNSAGFLNEVAAAHVVGIIERALLGRELEAAQNSKEVMKTEPINGGAECSTAGAVVPGAGASDDKHASSLSDRLRDAGTELRDAATTLIRHKNQPNDDCWHNLANAANRFSAAIGTSGR